MDGAGTARTRRVGLPRRRRTDGPGRGVLTVLGALFLAGAAVGLSAHFVSPAHPFTLGLTATAPYLMAIGSVVGLALLLSARQWIGVAVAVVVLALAVSTQAHLYIASSAPRDGRDLTVMTANLRLGRADADDLVAAVRRDGVEALMVQEMTAPELRALTRAGLDDVLGYRVVAPRNNGGGTGLWSRYPLSGERQLYDFSFATVTARVAIPGLTREPTLLAMHMSGPVPDSTFWKRDIARLPHLLRTLPDDAPVVIGGDFNATTDTVQFRDALVAGFHDAADQAGAGYPRTWPANRWYPPLIAIDHVLTRDAVGISAHTVEIRDTDHRALLTRVRLAR